MASKRKPEGLKATRLLLLSDVRTAIDKACDKLGHEDYKWLLGEVDDYVEACLEALKEDEERRAAAKD